MSMKDLIEWAFFFLITLNYKNLKHPFAKGYVHRFELIPVGYTLVPPFNLKRTLFLFSFGLETRKGQGNVRRKYFPGLGTVVVGGGSEVTFN